MRPGNIFASTLESCESIEELDIICSARDTSQRFADNVFNLNIGLKRLHLTVTSADQLRSCARFLQHPTCCLQELSIVTHFDDQEAAEGVMREIKSASHAIIEALHRNHSLKIMNTSFFDDLSEMTTLCVIKHLSKLHSAPIIHFTL